ncbi:MULTISPECIES: mechanosensitive ion channel family protein [unclassified Streptococcus]|uniref:mechanosensitive ion channel family protein n=1 Tax=unclassified Streptococcus TaxID=2608887 RepID=UPI001071EA1C|nr:MULTISPECIES: mechanosensitive ion channel family protein [unclassified Streptococcus]MBF0788245.1 mechanosensitive ion channel family protein [Streptococcus sp. 19428wC2_LYSM12]MCQ9211377.1 mechanosensitive ion channel family protein [Streptococcus sp. B01]MCQ9214689.1 mechanosensitive ion channel family protein [Streptococcus sp. O1]TFV04689.1 mechanosensitive ion channel family protein [Streptococcus sp. LYSM12]
MLMELVSKVVSLVLLVIVFYIFKKIATLFVRKVMLSSLRVPTPDSGRQKTIARLLESSLNYVLYFLLLYSILTILGLPVSSLLAGAGIAGVAIGMGAQGFLSDLVNGFFILLERQFDVGEVVRLTNGSIKIQGAVTSVGIRTTQVRDADGTLHFIPNRNILVVSNQSRGDMRVQIDLPLSLATDLLKVEQVIEAINQKEVSGLSAIKDVKMVGPQTLENGQFVFRIQFFVTNGQQSSIYQRFYTLYQEALFAAGIDLTNQ